MKDFLGASKRRCRFNIKSKMADAAVDSSSWAVVGLTAVVAAFTLLFVFLCNLVKKSHSQGDQDLTS